MTRSALTEICLDGFDLGAKSQKANPLLTGESVITIIAFRIAHKRPK
jgi:hypothetical protein